MTATGRRTTRPGHPAAWLIPHWPAPANVRACSTLRFPGHSATPYNGFNLALGVGDSSNAVRRNRALLRKRLGLAREPLWLRQEHGTTIIHAEGAPLEPVADGSWTTACELPCAVLTADCLPLLLCDRAGTRIAAVHAGWRGLAAGVIEIAVARLDCPNEELLAWLGPAIGPEVYEVGGEVRAACLEMDCGAAAAFRPSPNGRWLADLYALARRRLQRLDITAVSGGGHCTYSDRTRFYSVRRDRTTGRMATLIWLRGATDADAAYTPKPMRGDDTNA